MAGERDISDPFPIAPIDDAEAATTITYINVFCSRIVTDLISVGGELQGMSKLK
jgi:hypothetical protein